jgi:hypothetical protein
MTLPNASGFDIKRLVGHRYWTGTQFAQFRTFGNGSSKKTSYLDSFTVTTALSAGIFSSLSLATWLDGNIAGNANIIGYIHQSGIAEVDIWIRPTGSTQTAGNNNIFAGGHDDQSGPGNPTAAGVMDIILDTSATFQYQTGGGSTFQISLRGFEEHL